MPAHRHAEPPAARRRARLLLAAGAALVLVQCNPRQPNDNPPANSVNAHPAAPLPAKAPVLPAAAPLAKAHFAAVPQLPTNSHVLHRLEWGSGAGQLGHHRDPEAEPEGPMALDVAADGAIAVLDQVFARVQILRAGQPPQVVPVGRHAFQDVAWHPDGSLVLLDRLGQEPALVGVSLAGTTRWQVPLVGVNVAEGGAVTGLFVQPDGIWVEVEHTQLVRIAELDGTPDAARPARTGRPAGAHVVRAVKADDDTAVVHGETVDAVPRFVVHVDFPMPILGLRALDADAAGNVVLVAATVRRADDETVAEERLTAVLISANGTELRRLELPIGDAAEDQFRPIRIAADGALYLLACHAGDVTVERYVP